MTHGSVGATEKIPFDTTGNRSRDRPTSNAVPRPQTDPGAHLISHSMRTVNSSACRNGGRGIKRTDNPHLVYVTSLTYLHDFYIKVYKERKVS